VFDEPEQVFVTTIDTDQGEQQLGICNLQWSKAQLGGTTGLEMELDCTGRRWLALGVGEQLEGAQVMVAVPRQRIKAVRLGSELNEAALETFEEVPLGNPFTRDAKFATNNGVAVSSLTFATSSIGDTQLFRPTDDVSSPPTNALTASPTNRDVPSTGASIEPVPIIAAIGSSDVFDEPEQVFVTTIDTDQGEQQLGICNLQWSKAQLGGTTGLEMELDCTGRRWLALGVGEQLEGAQVMVAVPRQRIKAVRLGSELNEAALETFEEVPLGNPFTRDAKFATNNGVAVSSLTFATSSIGDTQLFRPTDDVSSPPTNALTASPTGVDAPSTGEPLSFIVLVGASREFGFPGDIFFTEFDSIRGSRQLGDCLLEWEPSQLGTTDVLKVVLDCPVNAWVACGVGVELEGAEMVLAVPRRRATAVRLGDLFTDGDLEDELEDISLGSASTAVAKFTTSNGVSSSRLEFAAASIGNTNLLDAGQAPNPPTPMVTSSPAAEGLPFIMAVGTSGTFGEPENVFTTTLSTQEGKEEFEGGCVLEWAESQLGSSPGLMVSFECPNLRWLACGLGEQLEGARVVLAVPSRPVEAYRLGSELSEDALDEYEKVTLGSASTRSASFRTSNGESSSRLEFLVKIIDDTPFFGIADDDARGNGGWIAAGVGSFFCASVIVGFVTRKRQSQSTSSLPVALAFEAEQDLNEL